MRNLFLAGATALAFSAVANPAHAGASRWLDGIFAPYGGNYCQFFDPAAGQWIDFYAPDGRCMSYAAPGLRATSYRSHYGRRHYHRYGLRTRG
ncbi:hypothetical protein GJW-30_1_03271 [Variibacter gotjawalensis]|uniref:YARHG domain-containing protein n=1 Tax=Variibacter gotjawalensis TaxID=1333996 RepID=A0A0S3PXS5_9BRAD|nr:hypothetical protein [Variibacter gotjawalensis]NIK46556.1 hypothetical protein [Variibacter gotjawalensis]RZS48460.1 hypothetical protein EV661_0874 [Variibacter gotjawalensis]BAT60722.1 hypothetical protein GJW-30_1_03271 [Variibacter gotjawalensis]